VKISGSSSGLHFTLQTLLTFQLYELIYSILKPLGAAGAVVSEAVSKPKGA
jgi:hypothetical protein